MYGIKAKRLATFKIDTSCKKCDSKDSIYMNIYQKYGHLFWIPLFPTSKVPVTECSHCKNVTEKDMFSNNMLHVFSKLKRKTKTPIWTFSGLVLVTIFVGVSLVNHVLKARNSAKFIMEPQVGDVYQMKLDEKSYSLAKVHHVKGDTTYLQLYSYSTPNISDIDDLKAKGTAAFENKTLSVVTAELKTMLDEGKIMAVER
jgi:hypothetical protein